MDNDKEGNAQGGVTETLNRTDDADKAFWEQLAESAKAPDL